MRPARLVLLLIFAAFLAAEPVIHTHPLVPEAWGGDSNGISTPNVCGVCAVGAVRVAPAVPSLIPPDVTFERIVAAAPAGESSGALLPSSSRAPPAA